MSENKLKILYVDDEENNLVVFKSSFRRHFDVITAISPTDALSLLKDNPVDVIISDQRMPEMSGVDFLKQVPEQPENVKIILTGYSDIESVIEALNLGKVHKYYKKPWQKEELIKAIDETFNNFQQQRGLKRHSSEEKNSVLEIPSWKDSGNEKDIDIQSLREEVLILEEQVKDGYKNVQLLSEIGQEITSTLDLDTILNTVYENVNQLMDATVFGIGIYNPENKTIDYQLAIEKGKRYKPYSRTMDDKNQFPVWCIENKKEIFINDVTEEYSKYINKKIDKEYKNVVLEDGTIAEIPESYIYMPLRVKDRVIGLISVQSFNKNAYTRFHLSALRNIGIFVATALENSKAFHMIETQKAEIEQKNVELEEKVEKRTQELMFQKDEVEATFRKLKLLTEIGQDITSTLNLDKILNTVYENVNQLMDASIFGIGIYSGEENSINYRLAIENGKRFQPYSRTMDDKNQLPVWCIENRKEIFINDVDVEFSRYIKNLDKRVSALEDGSQSLVPLSLIYIPLLFDNKPIGVLTVQGFRKYAYNQYHLDILRSLASYITTAILNAHSYTKMTEAFEQLKSAQGKLVESEKMASLGVLTAGVAHEINNPVNFVTGGIESLKDNFVELLPVLNFVDKLNGNESGNDVLTELKRLKIEIKISELLPEMHTLIDTIQNGAHRTAEIVKGLRNFTRLDENEMKYADLEEGIESTLIIINNLFKDRIILNKNYGKISKVLCYPGEINQVFMNILSNAADAIQGNGEVTITTNQDEHQVCISIKDTGPGIPENVLSHIFEPFYTTKAVGKGTGLGLSISYGIIEKHNGKIEVESKIGEGTEFRIFLGRGK